jgi:alpha-tubulin suppressor-like RCC1 family protein
MHQWGYQEHRRLIKIKCITQLEHLEQWLTYNKCSIIVILGNNNDICCNVEDDGDQ